MRELSYHNTYSHITTMTNAPASRPQGLKASGPSQHKLSPSRNVNIIFDLLPSAIQWVRDLLHDVHDNINLSCNGKDVSDTGRCCRVSKAAYFLTIPRLA